MAQPVEKNLHQPYIHELVPGSSVDAESKRIMKQVKEGKLKKIASRLYTTNLNDSPEVIIKRNWYTALSLLFPGCIIGYRSALEGAPINGHIFVTYKYTRNIELPGLTIHLLSAESRDGKIGTTNYIGSLSISSEARAYLENMQTANSTSPYPKTLSRQQIEEKLESIIRLRGEEGLNKLRDDAKTLAQELKMEREFTLLNQLIGALLTTKNSSILSSLVAQARALGSPFDPDRILLFQSLYEYLTKTEFKNHTDRNDTSAAYKNFAFFEGYFSNFIEGTEFNVDEAKLIIQTDTPQPLRDEDSHDILGTYHIVSDNKEMSICPSNADHLLELLRTRHKTLLSSRTSKNPGIFKDRNNRAGSTEFVDWPLVNGTLKKGFDFYQMLANPFAKAAYMMFLVSEVHPFLDGNGRVARVMMNAELSSTGNSKILIPTVYRPDYLGAVKRLTKKYDPEPYVRMLVRAYEFSATVFGEDFEDMERHLRRCNAFETEEGYILRF